MRAVEAAGLAPLEPCDLLELLGVELDVTLPAALEDAPRFGTFEC